MNRKLLVNELLGWSDLNENDNENILSLIEHQFKDYSGIKRKKTLPKRLRIKLNAETEKAKENTHDISNYLKKHIRFGINSITKELEKEPKNLLFVFVCKSCKPILTRHIQVMCSKWNVPAGCVKDLSVRLAKYFNIKSVSAFAITENFTPNESIQLEKDMCQKAKEIIVDLAQKIVSFIPLVKNPFCFEIRSTLAKDAITEAEIDISSVKIEQKQNEETLKVNRKSVESTTDEKMDTFGADFISFDGSNAKKTISFDSNYRFILFNDDFSDQESNQEEEITENNPIFDSFNAIRKRKLTTTVKKCNEEADFNQYSIRYRSSNQNRDKSKKKQVNKKHQLMNEMEKNRFKNTKDSSIINKKNKNKS